MKPRAIVVLACGVLLAAAPVIGSRGPRANRDSRAGPMHKQTGWHSIQIAPPPHAPKITLREKFNPVWWLKNADDPVPPEWFHPGGRFRAFRWWLRNPFHNFDCYIIGISDKTFVRSGRHPEGIANPDGGWNFAVSKYKFLRLPFLSYHRGKFDFYVGWRNHGNFGIKIDHNPRRHGQKKRAA